MTKKKKPPLTFIDLFAGCGGLSLGLLQAGWQGIFAIEQHPDAFLTLKTNLIDKKKKRPLKNSFNWPRWLDKQPYEISSFIKSNKKDLLKLSRKVTLVAGGPPCQGFSMSGRRNPQDPRNQLFRRYVDFVLLVKPKLILLENVPGFNVAHLSKNKSRKKGQSYAEKLRKCLDSHYILDDCLVRAESFGVPQSRDRYFVVGVRKDLNYEADSGWAEQILENIRMNFLKSKGLTKAVVTAEAALGDLEMSHHSLKPYMADDTCNSRSNFKQIDYHKPRKLNSYLRCMRDGLNGESPTNLRLPNHTKEVSRRFRRILKSCAKGRSLSEADRAALSLKKLRTLPLCPNKPAGTVTTIPDDFVHYSEPRTLTVRECGRIQSFPDWFDFQGRYTTGGSRRATDCPRYTQVGNAVPPFVANAWGIALENLLKSVDR